MRRARSYYVQPPRGVAVSELSLAWVLFGGGHDGEAHGMGNGT